MTCKLVFTVAEVILLSISNINEGQLTINNAKKYWYVTKRQTLWQ